MRSIPSAATYLAFRPIFAAKSASYVISYRYLNDRYSDRQIEHQRRLTRAVALAIVKHACERLGAAVRLTSAVGRGTTVEVQLPVRG